MRVYFILSRGRSIKHGVLLRKKRNGELNKSFLNIRVKHVCIHVHVFNTTTYHTYNSCTGDYQFKSMSDFMYNFNTKEQEGGTYDYPEHKY